MSKNIAVFGIYSTETDLSRKAANHVSVLLAENSGNKDLACEKSSKAPEGATAGAGTGAVVGGALGWLAGIGPAAINGRCRYRRSSRRRYGSPDRSRLPRIRNQALVSC